MDTKKRYKQIIVNNTPVIDFSEQSVAPEVVLTGNTFFDNTGNLVTGEYDLAPFLDRSVTEFHIPEGVTTLGTAAFKGCYELSKIYIPDSLSSIQPGAFEDCYYLYEVHVNSIDVWLNMHFDEYGYYDNPIRDFSATLCVQGEPVTKLVIPEGTTRIEDSAFSGWMSLEEVVLPDTIEYIGENAFYGCYNLSEINIPESVTEIGDGAFNDCYSLTRIRCFADEQPEGWSDSWNPLDCPVIWGYKGTRVINGVTYALQSPNMASVIAIDPSVEDVNIESSVEGYVVSTIRCQCSNNSALKTLAMPDTIIEIGEYAFNYCQNLQTVNMSASLEKIGQNAFESNNKLKTLTLPTSLNFVGNLAFANCSNLKNVYYNGTLEQWMNIDFEDCNANPVFNYANLFISNQKLESLTITTPPKNKYSFSGCASLLQAEVLGESAPESVFYHCPSLTTVTLASTVTTISANAFRDCPKLTNIQIPENITSIGSSAFFGCSTLNSITIPEKVTSIGNYAFANMYNLTEIVFNAEALPDFASESHNIFKQSGCKNTGIDIIVGTAVKRIPAYLFYGLSFLTVGTDLATNFRQVSFNTPSSCTTIGKYAFAQARIRQIALPSSITSIETYAFYDCCKLRSITFNSAPSIDQRAFLGTSIIEAYNLGGASLGYYLSSIPYVRTSASTQSIFNILGDFIFAHIGISDYLVDYVGTDTNLILPTSYNNTSYKIWKYAFAQNAILKTVDCSTGVTEIGERAFGNCKNIESFIIGPNVTTLAQDALHISINGLYYHIPASVTSIAVSDSTFGSNLKGVTIDSANPNYTILDGAFYNKEQTILYEYFRYNTNETFIMPNTVTDIYRINNNYLKTITFSTNLNRIWSSAFSSSITTLVLPDSLTQIDDNAFSGCGYLTNIKLGTGLVSIGKTIFKTGSYAPRVTIEVTQTTPCTLSVNGFGELSKVTKVIVPKGTLDIYKAATNWSTYATKMVEAA